MSLTSRFVDGSVWFILVKKNGELAASRFLLLRPCL